MTELNPRVPRRKRRVSKTLAVIAAQSWEILCKAVTWVVASIDQTEATGQVKGFRFSARGIVAVALIVAFFVYLYKR
jgi:hypothetical protein